MKFVKTALILMILLACNLALSAVIPTAERQALIDLYNSTNGPSWAENTNWFGAVGTEKTWNGVNIDVGENFSTLLNYFITASSPTISGFSPTSGTMGTTVIITGTNFSTTPASNIVKLNDLKAYVINATSTQLQVTIPEGANTGKFSVTIGETTTTTTDNFTVTDFEDKFVVRGLYVQFDRRGIWSGYWTGQVIKDLNIFESSLGHTVAEEVSLQLDEMKKIGVNTIALELRSSDPGWTGGLDYPACNVHEALGLTYPVPAQSDITNLVALFDLINNKQIKIMLRLVNTNIEEQPPLNNAQWISAILNAVKDHPALDLVLFEGNTRLIDSNGDGIKDQCGIPAEPPLWLGPSAVPANYVKWAIQYGMTLGLPANKLSAECVVGSYLIDAESPSGPDATGSHLWRTVKVLKQIFDDLAVPDNQRTYAISFYQQRKCEDARGVPCVDADHSVWAEETWKNVFEIIGRKDSRVVAVEMGLYKYDPNWATEQAFETHIKLIKRYGVAGGCFWRWVFADDNEKNDPTLSTPVKKRGLTFEYNAVKDTMAQYYLYNPSTISVTSPNGGESWQAGTTKDITWVSSATIANVKIELSFNGGDLWSTIIASTPNDGSYSWDIVKVPSLNCFMRISDVLGTSSDTSDAPFVLQSPPSLTNNYFILPVKWTDTPFGTGGWYAGDYNGDGRSDLLRYLLDGTRNEVLLSTGSAFAAGTNWLTADHGADGWHVGDYNGDGRSDLMRYVPGVSGAQVFLSNGSNFIYSGSWIGAGNGSDGWYVGDYNGDGRDDIMRYVPGVSGADVFLSDGTKFNYSGNWSGAGNGADGWYIGDFNGDGRSDLLRYYPGVSGGEVFLSDGTKFTYSGSWTGAGNGDNGWYLGKFSGTARTDIMRYVLLLSGADVFLNTGSGFTYDGSWTPAGRGDNDWHVGDFNGDGRDDLMRSIVGVTGADVLISNASGGATLSGKPLATQTKGDKGRWLGDVPFSEKEWDGAEEKAFVAAIKKRIAGGEELSVYQIQKEYEKLKGKACRRVSIMKLLKHYQWDSMYRIKADDLLQ